MDFVKSASPGVCKASCVDQTFPEIREGCETDRAAMEAVFEGVD